MQIRRIDNLDAYHEDQHRRNDDLFEACDIQSTFLGRKVTVKKVPGYLGLTLIRGQIFLNSAKKLFKTVSSKVKLKSSQNKKIVSPIKGH